MMTHLMNIFFRGKNMFSKRNKPSKIVQQLMKKYSLQPRIDWKRRYPKEAIKDKHPRISNTLNFKGREAVLLKCKCCKHVFPTASHTVCIPCGYLLEHEFGITEKMFNQMGELDPESIRYINIIENLTNIMLTYPSR